MRLFFDHTSPYDRKVAIHESELNNAIQFQFTDTKPLSGVLMIATRPC